MRYKRSRRPERRPKGSPSPLKVVILAGGYGSRLAEETAQRPKPMVEIGGRPILWHIMKIYSGYGLTDFVICLGYKGFMIKEYFANMQLHDSDVTIDLATNTTTLHQIFRAPFTPHDWQVLPYVSEEAPPALLLHGRSDKLVWASNTEQLGAALRAAGARVDITIYDDRGHVDRVHLLRVPRGRHGGQGPARRGCESGGIGHADVPPGQGGPRPDATAQRSALSALANGASPERAPGVSGPGEGNRGPGCS